MDRIIAVDGGKNTGAATFQVDFLPHPYHVLSGSPLHVLGFIEDVLVNDAQTTLVIAERFVVTTVKHSRQYDALEVNGALRWLAHRHGAQFEMQSRADRLRVKPTVVRSLVTISDDDQMSAMQHLILAGTRHGIIKDRSILLG